MAQVIARVPTSFDAASFGGHWFRWLDIAACFWPERGCRAAQANPALAPVRFLGGVYCLLGPPVHRPSSARLQKPSATLARRADFSGEWSNSRIPLVFGASVKTDIRQVGDGQQE